MTYYRGIKAEKVAKTISSKQEEGVYRGISWKSKDLEKSPKAPKSGTYRGVKWVA